MGMSQIDTDFDDLFTRQDVNVNGITLHCRKAGEGKPLLLLHGYPQTGYMWHKIAPALTQNFTVIIPDLRGYGKSEKPPTDAQHMPYSKRVMAADMVALMAHFGFPHFAVAGHDRGARVALRLARDHRDKVSHLAVLDIAPTDSMYEQADMAFGRAYYHWFFLIQPAPFPETLIASNPDFFLTHKLGHWGRTKSAITDAAYAEYLISFSNPDTIHASCEDYRAAASIDLIHDAEDKANLLNIPVLALWGKAGFVGQAYDVRAEWRAVARDVSGHAIPGGHFLPEESPHDTLAALTEFLSE